MFENIVVRSAARGDRGFDIGLLAEVIFFYGQVHLLINRGTLEGLVKSIGPSTILRMLRSGYVRASYIKDLPVIHGEGPSHRRLYMPTQIQFGPKDAKHGNGWSSEYEVREILERAGFKRSASKSFARQFLTASPTGTLNDGSPKGEAFPVMFSKDLRSHGDVTAQARLIVDTHLGHLPSAQLTRFRVHEERANKFLVDTDLNWAAAEADYKRLHPGHKVSLGPADVLAAMQSGFIDLGLAARYGTELLTSELSEKLVAEKVLQMMQARKRSADEIADFSRRILGDSVAIATSINSGQKKFSDFLDLMDRARKFKEMLRGANPDTGLLATYIAESTKESWLSKLAPKSVRFSIVTAAGLGVDALLPTGIGTMAGVAIGSFDTFVLDKLFQGWRPNSFVENQVLPFLTGNSS